MSRIPPEWFSQLANNSPVDHGESSEAAPPNFWHDDETPKLLVRQLDTVAPRTIEWLWKGWIPRGYITIWAGETGAGKSTVLADIAARVTAGTPWPGEQEPRVPGRVLWLGSEDGMEEMTVPRLMACGAHLKYVSEIQGTSHGKSRRTFSMQDDVLTVTKHIAETNRDKHAKIQLLVIDPVTSYLSGNVLRRVDMNDAGQLRNVLEPWLVIANKLSIAVVCVTHFAKDSNRSMLHRVLGSSAFAQTCRSLCAVIARPDDGVYAKALIQVKSNLPEQPAGAWKFTTERVQVSTDATNQKPIVATRPVWEGLAPEITANTVLGKERGPVGQYQVIFGVWIQAFFIDTPPDQYLPVTIVKRAAIAEGVASARWWDDHSSDYLEKVNSNGTWLCRRKHPDKTT